MATFIALIIGMGVGFGLAYVFHLKVQQAIDTIKSDFTNIHVRISQVETKTDAVAAQVKAAVADVKATATDPLPPIK
jgi:outer membrane murein-binding lipoprotein Lpp